MAIKFLDNLDLVGNQLQNVIIDVKNSAPASLGTGQLYMNINSSISTLVLDKGPKGGPHGVLIKDASAANSKKGPPPDGKPVDL